MRGRLDEIVQRSVKVSWHHPIVPSIATPSTPHTPHLPWSIRGMAGPGRHRNKAHTYEYAFVWNVTRQTSKIRVNIDLNLFYNVTLTMFCFCCRYVPPPWMVLFPRHEYSVGQGRRTFLWLNWMKRSIWDSAAPDFVQLGGHSDPGSF